MSVGKRAGLLVATLVLGAMISSQVPASGEGSDQASGSRRMKPTRSTGSHPASTDLGVRHQADAVPRELLIQYAPGTARAAGSTVRSQVGARLIQRLTVRGLELVKLPKGTSTKEAIATLQSDPSVDFAEPNYIYTAQASPNDPSYGQLWGLNNTGQLVDGTVGLADADIDAPEAWDITTGSAGVVVAVIDSGVAADHPDLAPNMVAGYDFVDGDSTPEDENGHGTHVAGTIGARGNNGLGVTGVAWNTKLMPIRALNRAGSGTNAQITDAVNYAVTHGADVVNMSLGGSGSSNAMSNAISSGTGSLFVVAAGNGGEDGLADNNEAMPQYPCNYPAANIVCVAATDLTDQLTSFSNYGTSSVDIAAPGLQILSTEPSYDLFFSEDWSTGADGWLTGGTSQWGLDADIFGTYATDSPGGPYAPNTDSSMRNQNGLNLSGRKGCAIDFWMYLDTEPELDTLVVQGSTNNGASWTTLDTFSGLLFDWTPFSTDLGPLDGAANALFRYRLVSDTSVEGDGAWIDDIGVKCLGTNYDSSSYQYLAGTSMATPHVAGVAALMLARQPSATPSQLKNALIAGADPKSSLNGKLVNAKRLNALGALNQIGGGPGPSPSPSATSTPDPTDPVVHELELGLRFRKHLIAKGMMLADDGYLPCTRSAPIQIYRMKNGTPKLVGSGFTGQDSRYSIRVPDKPGNYFAYSPEGPVDDLNFCAETGTLLVNHKH